MHILTYDDSTHRQAVIALWKNVFGYKSAHNAPALAIDKKIAVDDLFFVAEDGGEVIGTVMAGYDGHRGWIYSLATAPDRRGHGIGSSLLAHAEERLAALGCIKVNLQIVAGNESVRSFYEANGFAVEDRISMGKRLD
ncbi:GNAT family acetyltransferase [Pseudodesulfovibrio cashew]|uniref:GNAT family acetyltransferase n=1 Tax=Pseudodesulfovibrio cashew TaxID=2678688 RepID=A0A6I6JGS9_9BACT|nr:GNAT family acetyltransferase [Pseudodesulfovibrio cashew]